jgi:hypothetical protein
LDLKDTGKYFLNIPLLADTADDWTDEEGRSEAESSDFQAKSVLASLTMHTKMRRLKEAIKKMWSLTARLIYF